MKLYCSVVTLVLMLISSVTANDAVSATNFKTEGLYGNIDGETAKGFAASATLPVANDSGIQFDGLIGEINPDDIHGIGLHAFWRESNIGLFGLTASNAEVDQTSANRIGIEGEYYLSRFTLSGCVGHQNGDIDDSAYAGLKAGYYVLDDLMLSASANTSDGFQRCALGAEYQTPVEGLTCFASIATGEDDYDHAFFGLRFYFGGGNKTLIKRHREDDPANDLLESIIDTFMGHKGASSRNGGRAAARKL